MRADRDPTRTRMPELRVTPDARPTVAPAQSAGRPAAHEPRLQPPHPQEPRLQQPRPQQPRPQQPGVRQPEVRQPGVRQAPQPARPARPAALVPERDEVEPRYRRGEREVHTLRRRRRVYALRRLLPPVLVFVLGMFCAFLWSSGAAGSIFESLKAFALDQSVKAGLVVETVSIQGREKLSEAELREALGITKGTPIFAVDPEEARARVATVGWVKSAAVTRELPNTIKVTITERTPAALWQRDGELVVIDADGHPITSHGLAAYHNLLQVVGKGAEIAAADLMTTVHSEPELASRIKAAVRVGERRWDIVFKSGLRARLPEQNPEAAWSRLAALERKHRLLDREIHIIDLRQPDRLVLRLTEQEVARRKESKEALKPKGARV